MRCLGRASDFPDLGRFCFLWPYRPSLCLRGVNDPIISSPAHAITSKATRALVLRQD